MRCLLLASALVFAASAASAADLPNLVGTWKSTGDIAVSIAGDSPNFGKLSKPLLGVMPQAWTVRIDLQDGRAFSGVLIGQSGKVQVLSGVLRRDGKRFAVSTDRSTGDGDIDGDVMELCVQDTIDAVVGVGCGTYRK